MSTLLISGIVLIGIGQKGSPTPSAPLSTLAAQIIDRIEGQQYRRVGIVPRFLDRRGRRESWSGLAESRGAFLSGLLVQAMIEERVRRGSNLVIIEPTMMENAFREVDPSNIDLGNPETHARLGRLVRGMDAWVAGTLIATRINGHPGWKVRCEIVKLGSEVVETVESTLGRDSDPRLRAFLEPHSEAEFNRLLSQPIEPNPDDLRISPKAKRTVRGEWITPENLRVQVKVAGELRPIRRRMQPDKSSELWVALEPSETFSLVVKNPEDGPRPLTVLVDGTEILTRSSNGEPRSFAVPANGEFAIRGWISGRGLAYHCDEFRVRLGSGSASMDALGKEAYSDRDSGSILVVLSKPSSAVISAVGHHESKYAEGHRAADLADQPCPAPGDGVVFAALIRYTSKERIDQFAPLTP